MSKASNTPHDIYSFEFRGGPVPLVVESDLAHVDNGVHGSIRLFLFKRGSEAVGVCITVRRQNGRELLIDYGILVREERDRCCSAFHKESVNDVYCGNKVEPSTFLQYGRIRTYTFGHVRQELAVVTKTTKYAAELFDVRWNRHASQGGHFVEAHTGEESR